MSNNDAPAGAPERVSRLVDNAKRLARQDVAFVRQQVNATASHGSKAAAGGGAAAVLGLYLVGFLGLAGGNALIAFTTLQDWAAWLIVAGVFGVFILIALVVAKSQAGKAQAASKLASTQVKEDIDWAKQQVQLLKQVKP